ncbi:uncharacterized protein [Ptychodera flava]|uniref:uncharacterized protein n=1 Tax=Ptychodera flava TaxID=63121 RepID=UPI003969F17F
MTVSPTEVANDGQVAAVNVYFTDGNTKTSNRVPAPLAGGTPVQVNSAATSLGDVSASITMDGDCAHYTDLCAEILDGIIVWDFQCIKIGSETGQAGDKDCSVLTIDDGSLKITEPPLSDITYTTAKETSITLEMTISPATGLTGQVETVNVYFSDKDETQTDPVAGTFDGTPLQVTTANTKLDGVVASVILDENCAKYTHLCVQILDGTVIEDEDCLETGTEEGQAGDVDCSGSSGLLNAVGRFSILTGVLVVMTIRWM